MAALSLPRILRGNLPAAFHKKGPRWPLILCLISVVFVFVAGTFAATGKEGQPRIRRAQSRPFDRSHLPKPRPDRVLVRFRQGVSRSAMAAIHSRFAAKVLPDYELSVVSYGGYTTTVQLACQGLPLGAACQFAANPLSLPAGQWQWLGLTIQTSANTPLGTYPILVTAGDGALTSQLTVRLVVADYSISVSPASLDVVTGNNANLTVTVSETPGWTDLVSLSCSVVPQTGPFCGPTGSYSAGTATVTLIAYNSPPQDYSLTVNASSNGVSRAAPPVTIHVQAATESVSPASATIAVGKSANFTLSITSQNGLADQFTFSCPNLPAGILCTFSPASGTLPASGTFSSALTIQVSSKPALVMPAYKLEPHRPLPWAPTLLPALWMALPVFIWWMQRKRRPPRFAVHYACFVAVLLLFSVILVACGGGSSVAPTPTPPPPPPPATVTVQLQAASPSLTLNSAYITLSIP